MDNFWLNKKNEAKTIKTLQAENAALKEKIEGLEGEYNKKLEEAYEQLSGELAEAEKTAEAGYQEAYDIICDLRSQLEEQGKSKNILICDLRSQLEEQGKSKNILKGFPPSNKISPCVKITDKDLAAEMIDNLEIRLYAEYEEKVKQMKDHIVEKVDQFLKMEEEERDNIMAARLRKTYTPQQIVDAALEN